MAAILDRPRRPASPAPADGEATRLVLLGTLSVRFDPTAERIAIESALEVGAKLIVANMLAMPPYPMTMVLAPEYATLPHEEDLDSVRRTAQRAASFGIATELLRISTRHPVRALLELAQERRVGLLVFGPDPALTPRRRRRAAARAIRRRAPCLVWVPADS